ncbi:MAG: bifunctional phosphoribosylaminoimidazolecarboxamide formyltransferase/IMP cyclohydrolase, partial [Candidatus Cloacimonadaceae bacterium]|nr:bifunctional phosphoribosylaminoimidazolecarboxamide formyltransferase/IMP cyclohydrolase [Candidatus Cloacimonadaceae bacterium]
MKKYALISVSDKSGIEILAIELENLGYSILSTSNTAKHLRKHCREVVEVSDLTGFPEILDGRVKTLHPVIHAGILAERGNPEHEKTLQEMKIDRIDIVAVNLYPFSQTRDSANASHEDIIENIDIGGPTLIRAAAKNYRDVVVLTDPKDYLPAIEHLRHSGMLTPDFSAHLAQKAFAMVSHYDANITDYFAGIQSVQQPQHEVPAFFDLSCSLDLPLRYGENPHQKAGFYVDKGQGWEILHGKNLSFNNLLDVDASLRAIRLFEEPTVIIIKHCNPCGIGSGFNLTEAYRKAFATDTISPFGGIVVVNRPLDLETAVNINRIFTEIIIAPEY